MIRTLYYIFVKTVINFFVIAENIVKWIAGILFILLLCRLGCDLFLSLTNYEYVPTWMIWIIYIISIILTIRIISFFSLDEPFTDKLFGKWWIRYQAFDYTWRNKVAWFNAISLFVIAIIGWFMVFVFDTEFTRIAYQGMLASIHLLSKSLGIGYKLTLLALFYGNFFVKVLSCLLLFIALLHNRSQRENALIFTRSGICCILFYVCSIGYDCFDFVSEIFLEGIEQQCACIYDYLLECVYAENHSMAYEVFDTLLVPTIYTLTLNVILFAYIWNYGGESYDEDDSNYKLCIGTIDDKVLFRLVMIRTFYSISIVSSICKKRVRQITKDFNIEYMSHLTAEEENALLSSNHSKTFSQRLHAAVVNASLFTGLQQEYGSFILYICSITHTEEEQIKQPCTDEELSVRAAILANDLRFRGFKYIGEAAAIDILMTLQRSRKQRKPLNEFRLFNREEVKEIFNHGNSLKLLLVLISLLASLSAHAQIAGTVFDTSSHPLSYANVMMYSLPDSAWITGTTTDELGQYKFEKTGDVSSAYLKVSALGYVTKTIYPIANKQTIQLQPSEYSLGEAVVSGHREVFKSRGTDIIADIQHSRLRDFGFADDIIDKLPMVSGEHGNYSIFGKGNAIVYVGNRKLSDPSELARISTKDIATIEVISNPGVKYDADTHAVIRINLKKQRAKGWGATASLSDGQGRRNYDNEQVQLTYNSEKVNTFMSFSNSTSRYSTDQENAEYVLTPSSLWKLDSNMPKWKSNYYNKAVTGGISIDLNKNNTLGGQVTYQRNNDRYRGTSSNVMTQGKSVYERLISTIYSHSHYNQWQSNIYYEGHCGSKWTVNFNGDYLRRKSTDGKDNDEQGDLTPSHTVQTANETTYDIAAALAEAEYQINKNVALKFGTNVSYVKDTKVYNSWDDTAENSTSSLTSKETKTAFFLEGEVGIGKLSANLGTRYEMFKMSYYDDFYSQQLVDKNYSRFYPYLSMSLPLRDVRMGLSLTTKVQRPSYYQLRNSQEYFNRYETEAGNPLLLPQYTTDLSYSAQYKSLRFSMSYQWIKDYIMTSNIVDVENPLHILSKPTNKPHYSALSGNVAYNKTIGIWEFYTHFNLMRTFFNIYHTDGTMINGKRPYAEMSFNNYFNLKKDWMPYLLLRYNSDGYMREYRIKQGFFISMGITKHFLKKALYARLSINNILGTKERETRFDTNYKFVKERFKDNRNISLFIRYTFNNKKKYKGRSAASEEIDRM